MADLQLAIASLSRYESADVDERSEMYLLARFSPAAASAGMSGRT